MSITTKESFDRANKITKWAIILGLGALVFYFWGLIVPFVLLTLTNTIYTIIAGVVLFVLIYVLFVDKRLSTLAWYFYNAAMQNITKVFIETNPIAIMKSYLSLLKKKQEEMSEQIEKFGGKMGALKRVIDNNESARAEAVKNMTAAKELGKATQIQLHSREAGRLEDSNKRLIPVFQRMQRMYQYINKMFEATTFMIQDTESNIRVQSTEYAAVKSSYSIMKSAKAILNGDKDKKNVFDGANEFLQEDMGQKVGEIEHFMRMSKDYIDKVDVQNLSFETEGLKMIDDMISKDPAKLLGGSTVSYVDTKFGPTPVKLPANSEQSGNYDNLIDV